LNNPVALNLWVKRKMPEELEKKGWIKRTTIGEPRLSEIDELYKSLGYEVRVEPVRFDELDDDCRRCYEEYIDDVKTVYVTKKAVEQLPIFFHILLIS
jgi:hypothetical protein